MKRDKFLSPTVVISATVVLSFLVAGVIGGTTATAQGDIHVVMPSDSWSLRHLDWDDDGELELGDRIEIRAALFDAVVTDDRVGSAYGTCLVERRITQDSGLFRCTYLLKLADGTITVDGIDPHGLGIYELGVTGGTGAYSVANGEATFTDTNTETDILISFGT